MLLKFKDFFNTEINQTIGSQLCWLISTVVITLFVTVTLGQVKKMLVKLSNYIKKKVLSCYYSPLNNQKRLYRKIKKNVKKSEDIKPKIYPSYVSIKIIRDYIKAKEQSRKLEYKPLHDILVKYESEYPKRIEKYYDLHPDEKIEDELIQKRFRNF